MKIVVLDGFTLNPGDLSWDGLSQIGDLVVYDRTTPAEIVARATGAEVVLTNKVVLSEDILRQLAPTLKYVGVLATGYNVVDTKAARAMSICVTNIPAYSTASVVQHVFALLLNITNRVAHYSSQIIKENAWVNSLDFSYTDTKLIELSGKVMGVFGLGKIGMSVALVANAMGMEVISYTSKKQEQIPAFVRKVTKNELFEQSDVLSLHCPLTEDTRNLISEDSLCKMKSTAIIINTGRGPLVDEQAVAEALHANRIGAFAADVLSQEPPSADNPLLSAPRVCLTPHIAWASYEARTRLMKICVDNVKAFITGNAVNVVN